MSVLNRVLLSASLALGLAVTVPSQAQTRLPDWRQLSFGSLPAIASSGAINVNGMVRQWQAGMRPSQYLHLSDIDEALGVGQLSLKQIAERVGLNVGSLSLDAVPLIKNQTLEQLVGSVPGLGHQPVGNVPAVSRLLQQAGVVATPSQSLFEVLNTDTQLSQLQLKQVPLGDLPLRSLPGVEAVALRHFNGWEAVTIAEIPGLANLALTEFPGGGVFNNTLGIVARIDGVWGTAEDERRHTVSGSTKQGFNVPCQQGADGVRAGCAYLELDDVENGGRSLRLPFEGSQWISGKSQQVKGGSGCPVFANLNGGWEPTGRHPFGSAFKFVVWETDETRDTVSTALFFRISGTCPLIGPGHSPYFIGPVPFLNFRRDDYLFLGPEASLPISTTVAYESVPNVVTAKPWERWQRWANVLFRNQGQLLLTAPRPWPWGNR